MDWITLDHYEQLEALQAKSSTTAQVIFKHSRTCSISSMIKSRLERSVAPTADYYFLDLLSYRSLSDAVAHKFGVEHESPQVLIIRNGKCVYHDSHYGIAMEGIEDAILSLD